MDWKELQMTWTLEEPTRFAPLLAGETHLTEVNKDLTDELVAKGYKLIRSRGVAQQVVIAFGGLYFGTEDPATRRYTEHGGATGKLDLSVPWTNIKVRTRRANWYLRAGPPSKKAVEPQIAPRQRREVGSTVV